MSVTNINPAQRCSCTAVARFLIASWAALFLAADAGAAAVKSVQSGTVAIADGSSSATATISSVDTTKSFLVFGATLRSNVPSEAGHGLVCGEITNATTLTFERNKTGGDITIEWYVAEFTSGVSVQRGNVTMSTTTNVPVTSVDTTKSFPVISFRQPYTRYDKKHFVRAKITTSTNLQLTATAAGGSSNLEWQVVEFTDSTVQTGDLSFASSESSKTATMTSVGTTKSWLLFSYTAGLGTIANIGQKLVRGVITDPTTLTFDRDNTGVPIDLTWYLVEFTDQTTVRHGSVSFGATETQKDVPISAVNAAMSIASGGGLYHKGGKTPYSSDDNPGVATVTFDLTSATNLRMMRGLTGSATADVGWFVVDFSPGPNLSLADHDAGQESDAFTELGGETNAELFAFKLDPGPDTISVTQLVFRISDITGLTDFDWADVELVVDSNNDGSIGAGETTIESLGTVVQAAGTITCSSPFVVSAATSYILRADFSSLSQGDTVTIVLNSADVTASETVSGSTASVIHTEFTPPDGFTWFTNAYDISLSTTGSWVDIDLSSYVPTGTTGAVVEVVNTGTSDTYSAVVRGKEDTRDYMSNASFEEIEAETHRWQIVKVDINRLIQGYIENAQIDFKLLGYTAGTDPAYFTVPPDITPGTTGAWAIVDVASYVDPNANGVILFIDSISSSDRDYAIREVGSSYSTTNRELEEYGNTMYLVGLNGSDQFEARIQDANVKIYLVGETKGSVTYHVDDIAVADPVTGSWQELDADTYAISGRATGLIFHATMGTGVGDRKINFRHGDSTDDWNGDIGGGTHFQAAVGIRADNVWDQYMEHTLTDVSIAAYTGTGKPRIVRWREVAP